MKTFKNVFFTVILILSVVEAQAQVTIGSDADPTSTLDVRGSFSAAVNQSLITAASINISDDDYFVSWNGTGTTSRTGSATLPQLKAGVNAFKGRVYHIKNTCVSDTLVLKTYGSEKIDEKGGAANAVNSLKIFPGEAISIINNGNTSGVSWEVIGHMNSIPSIELPGAVSKVLSAMGTSMVTIADGITADLPGVSQTFTLDQPCVLLITYSALPLPDAGGKPVQGTIDLIIDGNKEISSYYSANDAPANLVKLGNYSTSQTVISLGAGTHTIKLQAKSWYNATVFNRDPSGYSGALASDTDAMKARLTIIVFNK